jgi:hypothetical protein
LNSSSPRWASHYFTTLAPTSTPPSPTPPPVTKSSKRLNLPTARSMSTHKTAMSTKQMTKATHLQMEPLKTQLKRLIEGSLPGTNCSVFEGHQSLLHADLEMWLNDPKEDESELQQRRRQMGEMTGEWKCACCACSCAYLTWWFQVSTYFAAVRPSARAMSISI